MKLRPLGNSSIKVSPLCLGTMTFGEQNDIKQSFRIMNKAEENGINFLDTAEIYSAPIKKETYGLTEKIIGKWLKEKKNRQKIIIASKIAGPFNKKAAQWIPRKNLKYNEKNISDAVDNSLKRLGTDYIDLYQLHTPQRNSNFFGKLGYKHQNNKIENFEEILYVIKKLIKKGKLRSFGISNETPWGLSKYLEISKIKNLPRISSVQNPYNLLNRTYEIGLAEISLRENCGLIGYSPLAFGYLTGKYRFNKFPINSRMNKYFKYFNRYKTPNTSEAIEQYYYLSKKYNLSLSDMAIKFCQIQKFTTSTIIGVTSTTQLIQNIRSLNIKFSKKLINEIDKIQKIFLNPCP